MKIDNSIKIQQESEARAFAERRTTEERMKSIEEKLDKLITLVNKKAK